MRTDPKIRLRQILKEIPFGPDQRELMEKNLEEMTPEKAAEILRAFEKAKKSAEKALKATAEYRKQQKRRKP